MALLCNKNHERWRSFGQYVQFGQPQTNWENIAKDLCPSKYNMFSIHLLSPFGNVDFGPWPMEANDKFNLDKKNLNWYAKLREMLTQIGGRANCIVEICFFDSYITRFNTKKHPFKHNNKNINFGDGNERALYNPYKGGNPNSDASYTWLSYRTDEDDNVLTYKFKLKFMEDYVVGVIKECEAVKKLFPQRFKIVFRVHNENSDKLGGDTRVHEIFEKLFVKYAPSFKIGRDLWQADDYSELVGGQVDLKELLQAHRYIRSQGRLQEIHNCDGPFFLKLKEYTHPRGWKFNLDSIIFSTDGLKPENNTFVPRCKVLLSKNPKRIDLKVPSDLTPYHDDDFEKTFNGVKDLMKDINQ